jgi:hypothetical protein
MDEVIFLVEEDLESGYTAKALGYSIFTEGETIAELRENIKDALECHFDNKADIPKIIRLHQSKEEVFAYV